MPAKIDVYKEWLGIAETARPLNYYQLLRLKTFEDDAIRIAAHYRKMNAHVRKYAAETLPRNRKNCSMSWPARCSV